MSSVLKTQEVSFSGGLDTRSTLQDLQNRPGVATQLVNFEQSLGGGYRRINGFESIAENTPPSSTSNPIQGIYLYRTGMVVCKDDKIYHTFDNITWTIVNRISSSFLDRSTFTALPEATRSSCTTYTFDTFTQGALGGRTDLLIHDGNNTSAVLTITGTSNANATFRYVEIGAVVAGGVGILHKDQHIVALNREEPSSFFVSKIADMEDFSGTSSGKYSVADPIIGLKSFREILYIFCKESIWKATELSSGTPNIQPVFRNIGCVSNSTIQEVGGDIVFLATDGLRSLGATTKIGDVNISSMSVPISGLVQKILRNRSEYTFTSIVIRESNQYRLFYTEVNSVTPGKGIIASYYPNKNKQSLWAFSEINDIRMVVADSRISLGKDSIVHGTDTGLLFKHNSGDTFAGTEINWNVHTPYFDLGDVGLRKNARDLTFYLKPEGLVNMEASIIFDYDDYDVHQPLPYDVLTSNPPSLFGSAIFGVSLFGSKSISIDKIQIQGSFKTMSLRFNNKRNEPSAPFTLQGFDIAYTEGSRI